MATQAVCNIPGCGNGGKLTRGWCSKHYQRWQSNGDPTVSRCDRESAGKPCTVDGCNRIRVSSGLCASHRVMRAKRGTTDPHPMHRRRISWLEANAGFAGEECLIWPFGRNKGSGRGVVNQDGRQTTAPRAMCLLAHGDPPTPAHEAAHSCGNGHGGCVSPKHLRWATCAENRADMVEHGTALRGEKVNTARLTEADVLTIRASSETNRALATRYDVSIDCIRDARSKDTWAWLE